MDPACIYHGTEECYINLHTIEWLPCMARHLLQNYSLQWAMAILKSTRFFAELTRAFLQFFH